MRNFAPGFEVRTNFLQTVSYTQFLYPTNVLGGRRNTIDSTSSFGQSRNASHRSLSLGRANSNQSSLDTGQSVEERRPKVRASAPSSPSAVPAVLRRERAGGLSRVRPQPARRPAVALRKTQEGPHFSLLHGEERHWLCFGPPTLLL